MLVAFLNAFVVEIIVVVETAVAVTVAVEAEGVDDNLRQVFRREKEA